MTTLVGPTVTDSHVYLGLYAFFWWDFTDFASGSATLRLSERTMEKYTRLAFAAVSLTALATWATSGHRYFPTVPFVGRVNPPTDP